MDPPVPVEDGVASKGADTSPRRSFFEIGHPRIGGSGAIRGSSTRICTYCDTLSQSGFVPYEEAVAITDAVRVDQGDGVEPNAKKRTPCFIEDFVDVACPFEKLRKRFGGDGQWLAPLATVATQDGENFQMRVGPSWGAGIVSREVNVTLWPPRERGFALARSLTWTPSDWQFLFPLLDGDLELAPIGPGQCRISLAATYTPALGRFGTQVDRALLHHVAASTVRSFLTQIATKLQSNTGAP